MLGDETQRRAALFQAAVLERRELIQAGGDQRRGANEPGMAAQAIDLAHHRVQTEVASVDRCAEGRPCTQVALQQQADQ
jgi:hypothetical protein